MSHDFQRQKHDHSRIDYLNYPINPLIIFEDLVDFTKKEGVYVVKNNAAQLNGTLYDMVVKHYADSFSAERFYPVPIIATDADDDVAIFSEVEAQMTRAPAPRAFIWAPSIEQPYLIDVQNGGTKLAYSDYHKTTCKIVLESQSPNGKQFVDYARSIIRR